MANDDSAVVARLFREVWSAGDLSILPTLMHPECVAHSGGDVRPVTDIDQYRQFVAGYMALYGELVITIDAQVENAGTVATRWTARPKSASDDPGLMGMSFHTVQGGHITQCWDTWDSLRALETAGGDPLERLTMATG